MPDSTPSQPGTLRVRFAPSPTGFLHVGSARTFIFNWLYARHNHGTMVLRLDDTDVERNTDASVQSIFEGLRWLGLDWDEEYKQSERLALHRRQADAIFARGLAYRDFTPAHAADGEAVLRARRMALQPRHARIVARRKRPPRRCRRTLRSPLSRPPRRRPHAPASRRRLRRAVQAGRRGRRLRPAALGRNPDLSPRLLRRRRRSAHHPHHSRPGSPHQHLQAPADLRRPRRRSRRSSRICRCSSRPMAPSSPSANTAPLSASPPIAMLASSPQAFINFLCLLGWSPKNDREFLTLDELTAAFTLEGVNRANAVINFTEEDPFDPKAVWLNAEHIRALPVDELSLCIAALLRAGRLRCHARKARSPSRRSSASASSCCSEAVSAADFFFLTELAPYDPAELIPPKGGMPRWPAAFSSTRRSSGHNRLRSRFARPGAARCRLSLWV